jgi:hypothetical protein
MHRTTSALLRHPLALAAAALLAASPAAHAIDVDAGDYTALPAGTTLGLLYNQSASRDSLYASGSKAAGDNQLDSNVSILRLIHFMKLGDYIVDPQVLLPFGELKAGGDMAAPLGKASGMGDAIFAATIWTINDPANKRYLGITPFLIAPTGSYQATDALNLGENRWKYALQVGYIQGLSDKITLDLAADVTAYGKNDKANAAGQAKKQNASTQLQAFGRYALSPTWDLRAGLSYSHIGESKLDGVGQNDGGALTKVQLGTAAFITPSTQLLATLGRDVKVDNGFKEASRLNLRLLQVF